MKKVIPFLVVLSLSASSFGGFKVKLVKPKKPEKYQIHEKIHGVTYAADLLLKGKEHKKFFLMLMVNDLGRVLYLNKRFTLISLVGRQVRGGLITKKNDS